MNLPRQLCRKSSLIHSLHVLAISCDQERVERRQRVKSKSNCGLGMFSILGKPFKELTSCLNHI